MKRLWLTLTMLAAAASASTEVVDVNNAELQQLLDAGVPVVDIRTPPEWSETGIVKGSYLLTFFDAKGRYDAVSWTRQLRDIATPEQPVILICRTGSRTSSVTSFLSQRMGYAKVYNVKDGILRWIAQGKKVVPPEAPARH